MIFNREGRGIKIEKSNLRVGIVAAEAQSAGVVHLRILGDFPNKVFCLVSVFPIFSLFVFSVVFVYL